MDAASERESRSAHSSNASASAERAELIERFSIPFVWRLLNLPGQPAAKCSSPFREDRHPSFAVFDEGKAFQDFSTGQAGNVFRFYGIAQGHSPLKEYGAFKAFLRARGFALPGDGRQPLFRKVEPTHKTLTGTHEVEPGRVFPSESIQHTAQAPDALKSILAGFTRPALEHCERIAIARGLDVSAPYMAGYAGTLVVGDVGGFPCWVLTDHSMRLAEARRIDAAPFPPIGSLPLRKSHTLKGSHKADWPLGVTLLADRDVASVILVEGGPDYLAAIQLIANYGARSSVAIAFMGAEVARSGLHPEADALLVGKRVRIIPHHDKKGAGDRAMDHWAKMLDAAGCTVDAIDLGKIDPRFSDLNDALRLTAPLHSLTQTALAEALLP